MELVGRGRVATFFLLAFSYPASFPDKIGKSNSDLGPKNRNMHSLSIGDHADRTNEMLARFRKVRHLAWLAGLRQRVKYKEYTSLSPSL